jgi:hypothetical protein
MTRGQPRHPMAQGRAVVRRAMASGLVYRRAAPNAPAGGHAVLTRDELLTIIPHAANVADQVIGPLDAAMTRFEIQGPTRQAAFLAQLAHESAELRHWSENLNYSWQRLRQVFPKYFKTDAEAQAFDRQLASSGSTSAGHSGSERRTFSASSRPRQSAQRRRRPDLENGCPRPAPRPKKPTTRRPKAPGQKRAPAPARASKRVPSQPKRSPKKRRAKAKASGRRRGGSKRSRRR